MNPYTLIGLILGFLFNGLGIAVWFMVKWIRDRGKIWAIELNTNTDTWRLRKIRPKDESYHIPGEGAGVLVKLEGAYGYSHYRGSRRLYIVDTDTGFIHRLKSGEGLYPLDGRTFAEFMRSKVIQTMNRLNNDRLQSLLTIAVFGIGLVLILTGIIAYSVVRMLAATTA